MKSLTSPSIVYLPLRDPSRSYLHCNYLFLYQEKWHRIDSINLNLDPTVLEFDRIIGKIFGMHIPCCWIPGAAVHFERSKFCQVLGTVLMIEIICRGIVGGFLSLKCENEEVHTKYPKK